MKVVVQKDESILPVVTLVLWGMTATVGVLGFVIPYPTAVAAKVKENVINAEVLNVELAPEVTPLPAQPSAPISEAVPLPMPAPATVVPQALLPVADPSRVAFAIPVEVPVQIVEPSQAAYRAVSEDQHRQAQPAPQSIPQQLTYGLGEGKQSAPEYPYRARREGQEGVVKVRFVVLENGRVETAELASGSPWSLLNEAALKVVRERWQFSAGARRYYEVAIRFQLTR